MKNVSIIVKNLKSGGAEKQAVLLAKVLCHDFIVSFVILDAEDIHLKNLEHLEDIKQIVIVKLYGNRFAKFIKLLRFLRKSNVEIIFSYLTLANCVAAFAGKILGIEQIYTGIRNSKLPFTKMVVERFLCNYLSTKTIANSYSGKTHFVQNGFDSNKLFVISNCYEDIDDYKEKVVNDISNIITVGRFVPQKDYETAIKCISKLKKSNNNFRFSIVGYGTLESQIRIWIKEYDIEDITTIYINPDNISELLNKSDIYLSTSLFEGTSNSIMEGLNANLPIVATNVGDNNHLVYNEVNGYLVGVKDVDALTDKFQILLMDNSLRQKMGKESKKILEHNYSINIFRSKYRDLTNK